MSLTVYVHPGSYSSWCVELLLAELGVQFTRQTVDLHTGAQFNPDFLVLSSRGTVPVLVDGTETLVGARTIREHLTSKFKDSNIFKGEWKDMMDKLDAAPVGLITYGLAFHQQYTKVLRYPFDKENFFNLASDYVLSRGQKLQEAALTCGDPVAAEDLLDAAQEHQSKLSKYVEEEQYSAALRSVHNLLDHIEKDLDRDDRSGLWLGGFNFSVADIALGLLLHRLWQLGMEKEFFSEGLRPHLTLYYSRIRQRGSFVSLTRLETEVGERKIKDDEDNFVDNARMGIGLMLVMGGVYLGKKLLRR